MRFNVFPGHGSIECKPWNTEDKGTAVIRILDHLQPKWGLNVAAIYIGDDTTDEFAMKALKHRSGKTMRIFEKGQGASETAADIVLTSTHSVVHFFHWFLAQLHNKDKQSLSWQMSTLKSDL